MGMVGCERFMKSLTREYLPDYAKKKIKIGRRYHFFEVGHVMLGAVTLPCPNLSVSDTIILTITNKTRIFLLVFRRLVNVNHSWGRIHKAM